jgi:hypothetical protein
MPAYCRAYHYRPATRAAAFHSRNPPVPFHEPVGRSSKLRILFRLRPNAPSSPNYCITMLTFLIQIAIYAGITMAMS